ncbi:hypothetical protein [Rhodococcoides corynebacterioides]|uniref:hypothetical protein n=1 Tax=Rhodococcoides corynebacterioides TaxID=53972 RepID=UPI003AE34D15
MTVVDEVGVAGEFDRAMSWLRDLDPVAPRVYAVADMRHQTKRRWWALTAGESSGRIAALQARAMADRGDPAQAVLGVAADLVHCVVGRVAASFVGVGRVWDPGPENLWVHVDSDCGIDWVGVWDVVLRDTGSPAGRAGVVSLPCERSLAAWTAHRASRSLDVVTRGLSTLGPIDADAVGRIVGDSVLGASVRVPHLGAVDPEVGWRRGQLLLDAFTDIGIPVRTGSIRMT